MEYKEVELEANCITIISKGIRYILIRCDVMQGIIFKRFRSDIIYIYALSNPPASLYYEKINNHIFYNSDRNNIKSIEHELLTKMKNL